MNLHINLIVDSERRSGSNISKKFIIYVLAVIVPVVLGLTFLSMWFMSKQASQRVKALEESWSKVEKTKQSVQTIQVNLNACKIVAGDISAWENTGISVSDMIVDLQKAVPLNMQLTRLTLSDTISLSDGAPARIASMFVRGKVGGDRPNEDVQRLEKALEKFQYVETATVMRYDAEADTPGKQTVGPSEIKVFDMECKYEPRKIR